MATDYAKDFLALCGWKENPKGVESYINDPNNKNPVFSVSGREVIKAYARKDTFLYEPIYLCNPNYKRPAQLIGDCTSYGTGGACVCLLAKAAVKTKKKSSFLDVATEAIYGGGRVEAQGYKTNPSGDGCYGAAVAKWVRDWGVLLRKDYSQETGVTEDNLTTYSGQRAKNWGYWGCGGKDDKDRLDTIARKSPVQTTSLCTSSDDAFASIAGSKCPVIICSNYGTDMKRDKNGFCRWNTSWPHCMVLIGARFDIPGFLCWQSWYENMATGPHYPDTIPPFIKGLSWWIPEKDVDAICKQGDSHCIGDLAGWAVDKFDWSNLWG